MKKTRSPIRFAPFSKLSFLITLFAFLALGCQKEDPFTSDDIDVFILNLPPVVFPAEQAAQLDSTATEQDPEYNYTIDYYTAAAGYDEQIALNPQTDIIYPGALIKGESILDGSYVPITADRKSITISTSLQGAEIVSVMVEDPKLSNVREAVNSLMNQEYDVPPANLGFTVESIYSHEQMDLALNISYSSGVSDVSSSFNFSNTEIRSRVVAKFIQNYYTLDLDLPSRPSDLIVGDPNNMNLGSLMPMYVSTVTFGRMALFTVESELSESEVRTYLEASYGQVDGDASADFEKLSSKSTMKVYVLGGSGEYASATINGFQDFKNYITSGGNFSKTSPGAPISYKLRYIHDNTIARVVSMASYPVRTAIPRTDNLRYDISVRLYQMTPKFADISGSNDLFGSVKSYLNSNPGASQFNWNIGSGGTLLQLDQNQTHTFSDNTTTNRTFRGVTYDDTMIIRIAVKEDDGIWGDEDLGVEYFKVPISEIVSAAPGTLTRTIENYGSGDNFMRITFKLSVLAEYRN
jgi:thiol-activated cytolysin